MKPISFETVEQTWQQSSQMAPQEGKRMVKQVNAVQPAVLAYLLSAGDDFLNQDEKELLLYLGLVVWRIMSKGSGQLPTVSQKMLRQKEEGNIKLVKKIETAPKGIDQFLTEYNQPEVLRYVVDALNEENPADGALIKEENKGMMMIYLKTVIDCFDL